MLASERAENRFRSKLRKPHVVIEKKLSSSVSSCSIKRFWKKFMIVQNDTLILKIHKSIVCKRAILWQIINSSDNLDKRKILIEIFLFLSFYSIIDISIIFETMRESFRAHIMSKRRLISENTRCENHISLIVYAK
jgi:hypothetical protein